LERIRISRRKAKKPPPYFYDGPPLSKEEKEEDADDVYDTGERETMLAEDDITAAEEGFMIGREQEPPSKKETRKNAISHDDQISVELAKEDAEED
jgi:hypothetical protein